MTRKIDMEIWQHDNPEVDVDVVDQAPIDLEISVEESKGSDLDMKVWQDDEQIVSVEVQSGYFAPGDIHYGDTLVGTGTVADPVNVAPEIVEKVNNSIDEITGSGNIVVTRSGSSVNVAGTTFVFEMAEAETQWTVVHNLNKRPSVVVVDSAGSEVEPEVEYIDNNSCVIKTKAPFKGKAYLN